jgi:hypothetical protein
MSIVLKDSDVERIAALSGDDLARLYQHITNRLRALARLETPNANVLSIRVAPDVVDHIQRLALRRGTTRSVVLRTAVNEFVRRNPA